VMAGDEPTSANFYVSQVAAFLAEHLSWSA
jgi:hypothetical protein